MGGSVGMLALFLLQVSPASSFGKVLLARPSTKATPRGATPASTSSVVVGPMRCGWAHTPAGANRGPLSRGILWEEDGRGSDHGWARFAGKGTADVDGKNKKSAAAAGRAAKKSSGNIGGWDWGFKSTPKKAAATVPAEKKTAPTAESKAKRKEEAKAEEAAVPEQGTAAAEATEKEQKDAAKAKLAQDKAKAEKRAEEEAAAMKAARIAQAKRAEEIAAMARGDVAKPAAKKAGSKPTATKDKDDPSTVEAADPGKATVTIEAEPAGAEPSRAKSAKAEMASTKKKSSGGGMGGWDWGFTPAPKAAAKPPAKPATGAAKTKAKKTTAAVKEKKKAKKEQASADADAVASAAEGAEKEAAENTAKAEAAEEKAAATARAEEERAAEKKARKEAAAARAAQEKRAEAIAAKARGDVPKPVKKKAPAETPTPATKKEKNDDGNERKDVVKGGATEKEAEVTKAIAQPAFAEKEDEGDAVGKGETEGDRAAPADAVGVPAPASETRGEAAEGAEKKAGKGEESDGGDGGGGIWDLFGGPKPKESSSPKTKSSSGSSLTLSKPETIVVVTGATGRVGSLTVRRLLELYPQVLVRAVVNDYAKGCRLLKDDIDKYGIKLEVVTADLGGSRSVAKAVEGASAVVFCASGFAQNLSPIQRLANAVRLALNPSSVADVEGVREVATALKATKKVLSRASKAALGKASDGKGNGGEEEEQEPQPLYPDAPRFVLLSSAAVTRPDWSDEEKALYPLAADVPIVKLNPLNILTVKAEGEKELRDVGIPYAVVRPCGLNDDHPKGRPLFSVGDTAAGRICREDVADVLVRCLATPEATGKTFEVQSLPGFEKVAASVKTNNKGGIDQALASLPTDEALENDPNMLKNFRRFTYPVLTQLRPVPLSSQASQEQED